MTVATVQRRILFSWAEGLYLNFCLGAIDTWHLEGSSCGGANPGDEVIHLERFFNEVPRTKLQCAWATFQSAARGHENDGSSIRNMPLLQLLADCEAIQVGQADIKSNDVEALFCGQFKPLAAARDHPYIASDAHQYFRHKFGDRDIVFYNQHFYLIHKKLIIRNNTF